VNLWQLPASAELAGETYPHLTDFREILGILKLLGEENRPQWLRWYMALDRFYRKPIPLGLEGEAMEYLSRFLTCGEPGRPGPRLLDWELDAPEILADINALSGREIREAEHLHWWTFLSLFQGIGEGRLSALVTLRHKLLTGAPLTPQERAYAAAHPQKARLRSPDPPEIQAEKEKLLAILDGN